MPLIFCLNTKHTEFARRSTPLGLLVLAHVLGCFFVSGSLPLAEKIQTPHPVEALITPESEIVARYRDSDDLWQELDRRYGILTGHNALIRLLEPETDQEAIRRKAKGMTLEYAHGWPEGFPRKLPETLPIPNRDGSELIDYKTRVAEEKLLEEAFSKTRDKQAATTSLEAVPSLQKDDFEIHHNAKRFVTSWVERNQAFQQGNFNEAYEWTKKAAYALDRNYELQINYLLNRKPLPNPYKTQEYRDVMDQFYTVLKRHQISLPTSETLASKLNVNNANRAAGVNFEAWLELELKALERLDYEDFARSLGFFGEWNEEYPRTDLRDEADHN